MNKNQAFKNIVEYIYYFEYLHFFSLENNKIIYYVSKNKTSSIKMKKGSIANLLKIRNQILLTLGDEAAKCGFTQTQCS